MPADKEYDIIFAGGMSRVAGPPEVILILVTAGTAACVAAGRLAEADPTLRILVRPISLPSSFENAQAFFPQLLEAGAHTLGVAAHVEPYRFVTHLVPDNPTVTPYAAAPSPAVGGRSIIVPAGHCVGGGSSVNCTSNPCTRIGGH